MQKLSLISIAILVALVVIGSMALFIHNPFPAQSHLPLAQGQVAVTNATNSTSTTQSTITSSTNSNQSSLLTSPPTSSGHGGDDGGELGDN